METLPASPDACLRALQTLPVGAPPRPSTRWWRDHPGARHGDLCLLRRVGRGGTATVYEARHAGRLVACKLLSPRRAGELTLARRLHDEGRHLAALGPGPWPAFVARGELPDGRPYLLMERLRGRTLRQHLRRFGPVAPGRARRWLRSILDALDRLHAQGLVHCDLKPENVFLGHDGRIDLLDLGAAERAGERLTGPFGTPPYMAPEQRDGGRVDARTDVFAAGWLAAELVGGPIRGAGRRATLSPRWREVIDRARAADPADRHPDARAFAAALAATAPAPVARARPAHAIGARSGAATATIEPVEVFGDLEAVDLPHPHETHRLELTTSPDRAGPRRDGDAVELELERLDQGRLAEVPSPQERALDAQLHRARPEVRHGHVGAASRPRAPFHRRMTHHEGESNTYM